MVRLPHFNLNFTFVSDLELGAKKVQNVINQEPTESSQRMVSAHLETIHRKCANARVRRLQTSNGSHKGRRSR